MAETLTLVGAAEQRQLDLPAPDGPRYRLLRAGVEGLWEYPAGTRFVPEGGWLHLRGANESGKSKAIELILPAVLDGHLTSTRLDPHRGTGKQMRWNLVGPHAGESVTTAVGYAFAEFGRMDGGGEHIFTCGYGVRAARNGDSHTTWLFTAEGVRVDRDLDLVPGGTPLTEGQLRDALGADGSVHDLRTHRTLVARTLFGTDRGRLLQLMELLLQLRTPQLGKTLDVAELSAKLGETMPQVNTRLLRDVSESFQQLQEDRAQLVALEDALQQLQAFNEVYRHYLRQRIGLDAGRLVERRNQQRRADAQVRLLGELLSPAQMLALDSRERFEQAATSVPRLASRRRRLGRAIEHNRAVARRARTEQGVLLESDEYRAIERLGKARTERARVAERLEEQHTRFEELDGHVNQLAATVETLADEESTRRSLAADRAASLLNTSTAVGLAHDTTSALEQLSDRPYRDEVDAALDQLRASLAARRRAFDAVAEKHEQVKTRTAQRDDARSRVTAARDAHTDAVARQREAEGNLEDQLEAWADRVLAWSRELTELPADPLVAHRHDPSELRRVLDDTTADVEGVLRSAEIDASTDRREAAVDIEQLDTSIAELESTTDPQPPLAPWRADSGPTPARPLYLVVEPAEVDEAELAGIEAALLGSGLLDALVHPDGSARARDGQLLIAAESPVDGPSLTDLFAPVADAGIDPDRVMGLLRGIAVADEAPSGGDGSTARSVMGRDGSFRIGALTGRHPVDDVAYLGVAARQRTRQARLAELRARRSDADGRRRDADQRLARIASRRTRLADERARLPDVAPIEDARNKIQVAERLVAMAADTREAAIAAVSEAETALSAARDELAAVALDNELDDWTDALDDFAQHLTEVRESLGGYELVAADLAGTVARVDERRAEHDRLAQLRAAAGGDVAQTTEALAELDGEIAGLQQVIGDSPDQLLDRAAELETRIDMLDRVHLKMNQLQGDWRRLAEQRNDELATAREAQDTARTEVDRAVRGFRDHEAAGRLRLAFTPDELREAPTGEWTGRTVRDLANSLVAIAVPNELQGSSVDARVRWLAAHADEVDAGVEEAFTALDRQLRPAYSPVQRRDGTVRGFAIPIDGTDRDLLAFEQLLDDDVERRRTRLTEQDAELLKQFLTGRVREDLVSTMRRATTLVESISDKLRTTSTNSGKRVRLRWTPTAEHRDVVSLLLRSRTVRTSEEDRRLEDFLRVQLAEARADAEDPDLGQSLDDLLVERLDYRRWHTFVVEVADPAVDDGAFRRLTSRGHGTGSGGSKSMLLHLPLFAALAAWYDGAAPHAPRVAALDEAFAGIDDRLTSELLALAVDLDLDLVTTAHDAWFCDPAVPHLAVYSLHRDASLHVVDAERFTWDGRHRVADDAP